MRLWPLRATMSTDCDLLGRATYLEHGGRIPLSSNSGVSGARLSAGVLGKEVDTRSWWLGAI